MHASSSTASTLRQRQIKSRWIRVQALRRKQETNRPDQIEKQKQTADQAISTLLYGLNNQVRSCETCDVKTLQPVRTAVEGQRELTPQGQMKKTVATVKTCDHLIRLAEAEPRLAKNQQLAVDYLKEVRASNRFTFEGIRKRLEIHLKSKCRLESQGQFIHSTVCSDTELNGPELLDLFHYGMVKLQPAVRHAMRLLLERYWETQMSTMPGLRARPQLPTDGIALGHDNRTPKRDNPQKPDGR